MKRFATLLAILVTSASTLFAQNLSIKGSVYDFDSGEAMYPANLQVFQVSNGDSTYVKGNSTDENGAFVIEGLKPGNYTIRASFMGYVDTNKNFTLSSGTAVTDLGKITIRIDEKMLDAVEITTTVAKVQLLNDTLMYNSAAFKLPEGSSVEDLLRKMPGIQIDSEGNITVNGKSISRILVNGKEFFGNDKSIPLTQLTADMIEKVKTYDKQSDLARQTGIDDGEEETVLDLQVQKGMAKGWFGNLTLGGGRPMQKEGFDANTLYQVNASLNRFDEDKQFTIMGSASQSSGGMGGMGGGMRMGGGVGGFGGMGGMGGGMRGGGGGVSKSYSGGANFALNLGNEVSNDNYQYEVGGSVNWSHNDNTSKSKSSNENWYPTNNMPGMVDHTWGNNSGKNGSGSESVSGQMRIEWNKDNYTSLLFQPQFSYSKSDSWNENQSRTFKDDPYKFVSNPLDPENSVYKSLDELPDRINPDSVFYDVKGSMYNFSSSADPLMDLMDSLLFCYDQSLWNSQNSKSKNVSTSKSASGNLQFVRRFGNRGRNVSVRGQYNLSHSDSKQYSHNNQYSNTYMMMTHSYMSRDTTYNRYNINPSDRSSYSIQATYSEPISTGTYLQLSYQFSYSAQNSDRATYNLYDATQWELGNQVYSQNWGNDWNLDGNHLEPDGKLSTESFYYNYDQTIQLQFRKNSTDNTYNFTAGLSILPQYSKMNYTGMGVEDTILKRTVFNWTPTLQFRYRVSSQEQINIRYNGRSSQPSMQQLLDIRDDTDPLRVSSGNPGLKPTFSNQLSLGYQKYNPVTMGSFNINTGINNNLRSIQNRTDLLETGGTESKPINMEGFWSNWSANASVMYNYTFPDDRYSISSNTSGNFNHSENWTAVQGSDAKIGTGKTISASERLDAEFRDDYLTAGLQGNINFSHSTNDLQPNRNMDTYTFNYGASFTSTLPWRNARLASDLQMQSRRGYDAEEMNTDELIWNASFSFSFLKGNKASMTVSAYDILHQRSTVSRNMTATSRTDTESQNITSYFMVSLNYRLSMFGDRNARQSMRGRGGFGGGMGGFGGGMGGFGGGMGGFGGGMGGFGGGMGGRF